MAPTSPASRIPYIPVPPPPLPEFYQPRTKQPSRVSSSAHSTAASDDTDDRPRYTFKPANSTAYMSAPPAGRSAADVPPLAVYHICRICLRPRSARYHREHPIPIDGMPPPPTICRRCRVSSVDDLRSNTEVAEHKESNNMRIGVASLVPDRDYLSSKEMMDFRASRTSRGLDIDRRKLVPTGGPAAHAAPVHKYSNSDAGNSKAPSVVREEVIYRHTRADAPRTSTRRASSPPPVHKSGREVQYTIKTTTARPEASKGDEAYKTITIPPPPPTFESIVRRKAASGMPEVQTIASSDTTHASESQASNDQASSHRSVEPARSESEIRRLAREEVVYYRQAERKLEAHRDPYAHGRMVEVERVPVQRRIDVVREADQEKPWETDATRSRRDSKPTKLSELPRTSHDDDRWQEVGMRVHKRSETSAQVPRYPQESSKADVRSKSSLHSEPLSDKTRWPGREPRKAGTEPVISSRVDELREVAQREQTAEAWSQEAQNGSLQTGSDTKNSFEGKNEQSMPAARGRPRQNEAHASARQADATAGPEVEYIYKRRTVTPVGRRWEDQFGEPGDYYKSSEEFIRRGGSARPTDNPDDQQRTPRKLEEIRRRVSDASSRVRFSKKVDVSPTPPESDASSSDFQKFAYVKARYDGQSAKEVVEEYTSRGRSRATDTERERKSVFEVNRDPTPRPRPSRDEKPARSSESAPLPVGASAAALSESPSREEQRLYSYKPAKPIPSSVDDGYGPYSTFLYGRRSPSLLVEDGSTQASSSSTSSHHRWQRTERKSERR